MLEAMQSLRDELLPNSPQNWGRIRSLLQMQSLELANKFMTCPPTGTQNRTLNRTSKHPNTWMNPLRLTSVVFLYLLSSVKMFIPRSDQVRTDWIKIPTLGTTQACLGQRITRTKENIRFGLNMFLSHLLQRNLSPLYKLKSLLLSPLIKTNNKQIQFFIGR